MTKYSLKNGDYLLPKIQEQFFRSVAFGCLTIAITYLTLKTDASLAKAALVLSSCLLTDAVNEYRKINKKYRSIIYKDSP